MPVYNSQICMSLGEKIKERNVREKKKKLDSYKVYQKHITVLSILFSGIFCFRYYNGRYKC